MIDIRHSMCQCVKAKLSSSREIFLSPGNNFFLKGHSLSTQNFFEDKTFLSKSFLEARRRAEANGGAGGWSAPPADHLSENFAPLSEFLCSK